MQKMVPLDQLKFGHEADPPINARKVGREEDVTGLAASIESHGLGQALNVRDIKGQIYVADGNRRLAALRLLVKQGNIVANTPVKCEFDEKDGVAADELSLALNIQRVAMHPADQYEQFHRLHESGLSDKQIAVRFGYDVKIVRKALALGKLSPLILEAWREDKLGHSPEDVVAAFTLAPNLKEQEAVFKRMKKAGHIYGHYVREAFGAGNDEAVRNVKFVGAEAYKAAGGSIVQDLFGDHDAVSDPALAAKLVREKLIEKRDELRADGWGWAELAADMPTTDWLYYWQKIATKKDATAEEKAKSGCVVGLSHSGSLEVHYGVVKPSKAKVSPGAKAGPPAAAEDKGPAVLSNALHQSLEQMAYVATQAALKAEAHVSPLAGVLAGVVAAQINSNSTWHTPGAVRGKLNAIRDAITPEVMAAALQKAFDAERYFKGAPKEFVLKAVREAVSPEQAKKLAGGTKAAAWKFALENVAKTGWLPPELRTAHYAKPAPATTARPRATPKAKKAKPEKKVPAKKRAKAA